VRPHRAIARGGSRVTRGKRSVFPEWHVTVYRLCAKKQSLRKELEGNLKLNYRAGLV